MSNNIFLTDPDAWKEPQWKNPFLDWKIVLYARELDNNSVGYIVTLYKFGICGVSYHELACVLVVLDHHNISYMTNGNGVIWVPVLEEKLGGVFTKQYKIYKNLPDLYNLPPLYQWKNPFLDWKIVKHVIDTRIPCYANIVTLYKFGVCMSFAREGLHVRKVLDDNNVEYGTKAFGNRPRIIWLKSVGENLDRFFSKKMRA